MRKAFNPALATSTQKDPEFKNKRADRNIRTRKQIDTDSRRSMYLRHLILYLVEQMPATVLNGAFLKDSRGNDFLLVVDVRRDIQSVQDAARFHLRVGSTFEFPVVLAWFEAGEWRIAGPQPWKSIAEKIDLLKLRLYQIPISDPDTEKQFRDRKRSARGDW